MAITSAAQRKKEAADLEELHRQLYPTEVNTDDGENVPDGEQATTPADGAEAAPSGDAQEGAPSGEETGSAGQEAEPAPEAQPVDLETAVKRYESLQGKYEHEVPALQAELARTQAMLQSLSSDTGSTLTELLEGGEITEEDMDAYGPDMIALIRKVATNSVRPVIDQLQNRMSSQSEALEQASAAAAKDARDRMLSQLDVSEPGWREVNESNEFLDWLAKRELYSNRPKLDLLREAFENNETSRVLSFFRGYKQEQTGNAAPAAVNTNVSPKAQPGYNMDSLVVPGKPAGTSETSGAPDPGPVWTQPLIANEYERLKKTRATPEQVAAFEAEIIKASTEGRVV